MASLEERKTRRDELIKYRDSLRTSGASEGQNTSWLGDLGTDTKRGVEAIPGIATGILDIVPGALFNATPFDDVTDYIGEATGFQPGRFAEEAKAELSPDRQASDARVAKATGFLDTFAETLANPRSLAGVVAESLPSMVAGGFMGKGLQAVGAVRKGTVAVGVGEGAVSAGGAMESLTDNNVDPRTAAIAATATGVVVGAIGVGGASLAQRMKIADPDLIIAGLGRRVADDVPIRPAGMVNGVQAVAKAPEVVSKLGRAGALAGRVGRGALQEGIVEEAPQSAAETMIANLAMGKDVTEGLGESVATGLLAGAAMGGAFNLRDSQKTNPVDPGAPALRDEVVSAVEAAGFNMDTLQGQVAASKIHAMDGDPVANAKQAKQDVVENFKAFITELITTKGNGVGGAKGERLINMINSEDMNSKEGIDRVLATSRIRHTQRELIRETDHYSQLPDTAAEAAAQPEAEAAAQPEAEAAAQPEAEAAASQRDNPNVVPTQQQPLSEEETLDRDELLAELEVQLGEDSKVSLADNTESTSFSEKGKGTSSKGTADKGGFTRGALRGLAGLINGFTTTSEDRADITAFTAQAKDVKGRLASLKAALPQYYTVNGKVRKNTKESEIPTELRTFLNKLPTLIDRYGGDGRVLAGVKARAEALATKYNAPALTDSVASLARGYELLKGAKAAKPLSQEVRGNLRRMGVQLGEGAAADLDTLFTALHDLATTYDGKVNSTARDDPDGTDYQRGNLEETKADIARRESNADSAATIAAEAVLGEGTGRYGKINQFQLAQDITEIFGAIESMVGRTNLRKAMGVTKGELAKQRKSLPGRSAGKQTKPEVLFSQLYSQYMEHGVLSPTPSRNPMRLTNEEQSRREKSYTNSNGDKVPYSPVVIAADGTVTKPDGQPEMRAEENIRKKRGGKQSKTDNPVALLLTHLSSHSLSPVSRMLATRFRRTLEASGYSNNLSVVMHPEDTGPNGEAGKFIPMQGNSAGAEIHLWAAGQRESTILHETLHALVVGMTSQWKNNPDTMLIGAKSALDALSVMQREVVAALSGQQKNKNTPLPGRLSMILRELSSGNVGLDEFITYAMTDSDLQLWMRGHVAPEGSKLAKKNWWSVFAAKLKTILNLQTVPNSVVDNLLDSYLDAASSLLAEVDTASRKEGGLDVFFMQTAKDKRAESMDVLVEDIIENTRGISSTGGPAKRLRKMASGALTKKSIDAALKGMPKTAQDAIRASAAYTSAPDAKNPSKTSFAEVADPAKFTGTASSDTATQAAEKDASNVNTHRATAKAAAEEADRGANEEAIARDEEVRARNAEAASKTSVTQLKKGKRIGPNNATVVDRVERNIADGLTSFLSAGAYKTYEEFTADMMAKAGGKIVNLRKTREGYVSRNIGKFLSNTVDMFGVPAAYRNAISSFEHAFKGKFNDALASYEGLVSLTMDQQQALLDYLYNKDEVALKANIPDAAQQRIILDTTRGLEELLDRAKALGMVKPKDRDKTVADFLHLGEGSFRIVSKVSYKSISPPSDADNLVMFTGTGGGTSPVDKANVISKDGSRAEFVAGKEYYMAAKESGGSMFAVEVGADTSVWNDYGVAPLSGNNADTRAFRVSDPSAAGEAFTFYRKVTARERSDSARAKLGEALFKGNQKARAHVVSGLTRLVQEWGRNIQGRETIEGMVDTNKGLPESDRWITDKAPTGVEESRIVNVTSDGEALRSKALRAKLRVPGNWALIDDNPRNRELFGDMAGKYVAGPVYTSMLDYYDTSPLINSTTFRATLTAWKKGKTVFSPVAHVNNISGNLVLAYYYDLPAENILKSFNTVVYGMRSEEYRRKHPNAEFDALLDEMKQKGLTLSSAQTADFDVAAEAAVAELVRGAVGSMPSLMKVFTLIEKVSSKSTALYSNQDNVFRLATYMTHIQDNTEGIGPDGVVGEEVKNEAARKAEQAFVDYRIHAPWVKAARESVLPFIAWPYRMFPMLMKVLITKPWKAANTMGAIYTLNAMAYAMLGDEGDEEEERNLMPEWNKEGIAWLPGVPSNIRLPFGSGDNAYFWNISRAVTLADMDQINGSGVPSMIMPGGPAMTLVYAMNGYDPFTGKELSSGVEDLSGFLESRGEYLFRGLAPGAINTIVSTVKHAGETGPLGYDKNFWVDAAKVLGISTFQVNKPEAAFYKDIARKSATREFNAEIGRVWRRELRQKSPDFDDAANTEIELQQRLTLRLQELNGEL